MADLSVLALASNKQGSTVPNPSSDAIVVPGGVKGPVGGDLTFNPQSGQTLNLGTVGNALTIGQAGVDVTLNPKDIILNNAEDHGVTVTTSAVDTAGRALALSAGTGGAASSGAAGVGGAVSLTGGVGGAAAVGLNSGDGGAAGLTGGAGGAGATNKEGGAGGAITLQAGAGGADGGDGAGSGGHVELKAGTSASSPGEVRIYTNGSLRWAFNAQGDLVPDTAGAVDLGGNGGGVGDIYQHANKSIYFDNNGTIEGRIQHDTGTTPNQLQVGSGDTSAAQDSDGYDMLLDTADGGSASASGGGRGGDITVTLGAGGTANGALLGGVGGGFTVTGGTGGAGSGALTSGDGGAVSLAGGLGGLGNATAVGGDGGDVSIDAGAGGAAAAGAGSGGAITIGGTNAESVAIGRSGKTTTVNGTLAANDIDMTNGTIDSTGSMAIDATTTMNLDSDGAMTIAGTSTGLTVGKAGVDCTLNSKDVVLNNSEHHAMYPAAGAGGGGPSRDLSVSGGAGGAAGGGNPGAQGGQLILAAGAGGAGDGADLAGEGAQASLTGGAAGAAGAGGGAAGGQATVRGGAGSGAFNGGGVSLIGGAAGATGDSGGVGIASGAAAGGDSGDISIDAGTASGTAGKIDIGVTNADEVNIGRATKTTTVSGTLAANDINMTNGEIDSTGTLDIEATGVIQIGNDAVAAAINIGTGAAARAISIGNAASASLTLEAGVGALNMSADAASTWSLGGTLDMDVTGAADIDSNAAITIGGTNATTVNIGRSGQTTTVKGDLVVDGTTTTVHSEEVNLAANHMNLNAGYTTVAAQNGGIDVAYLPTATTDTSDTGGFATTTTVKTVGAATFAAKDFVQISGSANPENDGIFEVLTHAANTLTIDSTPVFSFCNTAFVVDTTDTTAVITKVNYALLQCKTDGVWQTGKGADSDAMTASLADVASATLGWDDVLSNDAHSGANDAYVDDGQTLYFGTGGEASALYDEAGNDAFEIDCTGSGGIEIEAAAGPISIGADDVDQAINIGTQGERTISIATGAFAATVNIGNETGASSVVIKAGTGNIDIGTGAQARAINIGTGAAIQTISIGTGVAANVIEIGDDGAHAGTVTLKSGTTGDITFDARGMTNPMALNTNAEKDLVGFTATALIPALNELKAGSGNSLEETVTAGEALTKYRVVFLDTGDSAKAKNADADVAAEGHVYGVVGASDIADDATGDVVTHGRARVKFITGGAPTLGAPCFLSLTAGEATDDVSAFTSGDSIVRLGVIYDITNYAGGDTDETCQVTLNIAAPILLS